MEVVPMPEPTPVPMARARAHVLAKQGLGTRLPAADAVVATAGIYGTAPTCYLSTAARAANFRLADLDALLCDKRSVIRLRCMRGMAYIERSNWCRFCPPASERRPIRRCAASSSRNMARNRRISVRTP
jgi:hypothetical protein